MSTPPPQPINTITLSALAGEPLADARVRETVLATARAIAERIGVEVVDVRATDSSISATLRCRRIEAWGFAAELRRLTNAWYAQKFGERTLWGEAPKNEDEDEDEKWRER